MTVQQAVAHAALPVGDQPRGSHPAVDELGEDYLVFATPSPTVRLTDPFAAFVTEAALRKVRPVLVTSDTTRLSPFVSSLMPKAGGLWAVHTADGTTYDALSGDRIDVLCDKQATGGERLAGFDDRPAAPQPVVTFDVHTAQRAEPSSQVGVVAETIGARLGARWEHLDVREPLLDRWDVAVLTRMARERMPESPTFLGVGTGGAYCQVQVARTKTGLLEHTFGGVPVVEDADVLDLATQVAQTLGETHNPTLGFVSLADYDRDLQNNAVVRAVRARPPESPLVLLIGPRGVRDLRVDPAELARDHDVLTGGRAKMPYLLVRFHEAAPVERWSQMVRLAEDLGDDNIARALRGGR